jgi:hypothetical protein
MKKYENKQVEGKVSKENKYMSRNLCFNDWLIVRELKVLDDTYDDMLRQVNYRILDLCDIEDGDERQKKYDKLLARHYRDIWDIYAQSTNFVVPLTNRVKDVFRKSISVSESNKANNMIVFGAMYLFLVEIAVLSTLSLK